MTVLQIYVLVLPVIVVALGGAVYWWTADNASPKPHPELPLPKRGAIDL